MNPDRAFRRIRRPAAGPGRRRRAPPPAASSCRHVSAVAGGHGVARAAERCRASAGRRERSLGPYPLRCTYLPKADRPKSTRLSRSSLPLCAISRHWLHVWKRTFRLRPGPVILTAANAFRKRSSASHSKNHLRQGRWPLWKRNSRSPFGNLLRASLRRPYTSTIGPRA